MTAGSQTYGTDKNRGEIGGAGPLEWDKGKSWVMDRSSPEESRASLEVAATLQNGRGYSPRVLLGPDAGLELEAVPGYVLGQFVNNGLDVGRRRDDGSGRGS